MMKWLLALLLCTLAQAAPAASAEVLFQDNFDDGNAIGWQELDGQFTVDDGVFRITSEGSCQDARAANGDAAWADYGIDVDFKFPASVGSHAAVLFRVESIESGCDAGRYYQFAVFADKVSFCRMNFSNGSCSVLKTAPRSTSPNVWHHARVVVRGVDGVAFIDDEMVLAHDGFDAYPTGRIALKRINGGTNEYDNVVVSSLGPSVQENPPTNTISTLSGVTVISGWKCNPRSITVSLDGSEPVFMASGTTRGDTKAVCQNDGRNGYGLLINVNLLGDGRHTARFFDEGIEFAQSTFDVVTFGQAFVTGLSGTCVAANFPGPGQTTTATWVEGLQGFMITETP